ncbi:hypothetical protein BpHYR1_028635 [Brachionus plicatilis]|uniref:RING-type domain-containing protein n=1 Tax=Brachionus plicatilis TaxID=10195 RepID=A0A3M7RD36_BRAPC|nr:hypothetical protein BpHYR1_028635 [Brachionus plicatilis]
MNTEDFCSNCKSFFGHIKYPVLLNCCQKNICNLCYRKLIDSKSLECIKCNDPNFTGAPNLEKNKVLFFKLFNQTEKKLDELHVKVYDAKWKNIVKAIKFYTNQSDYWPVEKTDRYDLSILRKIYESLTSEQEDKIKVFLRRFHSILKGIKNQKEKIASSSLETITKDIESFQDFFDEINIFMSQSFIKPFSDSDIELRLNEEKLERQNNIDFCFRVILDLKQLMNQAFERKVHKIQSYLIFLKNLFEALRPLLSIKKFQHNSLETDPKLMTLSNQDLFIYDFLVNKIKSTQKQLREYYNEQQKITNLLNSEYEKLLNCKNNEIRLYDERELTKLEKIVNTFLSIKPCRDLSFSYIDDARRNFEFFDEIYLVCDYSDFVQTINKDDPSVKIKNLVKNFKNSKGCFKCPTISQFQILKRMSKELIIVYT